MFCWLDSRLQLIMSRAYAATRGSQQNMNTAVKPHGHHRKDGSAVSSRKQESLHPQTSDEKNVTRATPEAGGLMSAREGVVNMYDQKDGTTGLGKGRVVTYTRQRLPHKLRVLGAARSRSMGHG